MTDIGGLNDQDLAKARAWAAATYLSSHVRTQVRALDMDESDTSGMDVMAVSMVEPMNIATEAIWRAVLKDQTGVDEAMKRFRTALEELL